MIIYKKAMVNIIYKRVYMNNTNVQWHPRLVSVMNLEFAYSKADLIFEKNSMQVFISRTGKLLMR